MWFLYGFLALQWFLFADFTNLLRGGVGPQRVRQPPAPPATSS